MKQAPIYNALGRQYTEVANPEILVGQIKNITIRSSDIKPMLTVRLNDGSLHHNVEIINNGTATGNGYIHTPIDVGGFVYCLKTYENQPLVCLGGALKPQELGIEKGDSVASINSDRKAYNMKDLFLVNDENKVNLTHLNGLVLESEKQIRLQLGEDALLRISRFGKSGDNILDGSKFIDILFAYIKMLEEKINQHSQWIENATPQVAAAFTEAADVHRLAAIAARALSPPNEPLARIEDENQKDDSKSARDTVELSLSGGTPLSVTSATAKTNARTALNPYVQTPFQD